jgi:hypothetical protein
MTRIAIILALFLTCSAAQAQSTPDTTNLMKVENLQAMSKKDLTEIYLLQVTHLLSLIPKCALNVDDAPSNKFTDHHWKNINKSLVRNNDTVLLMYKDIIPYADKENIIDAIMWLQEITLQMETI